MVTSPGHHSGSAPLGRESVESLLASFKGGPELGGLASDLAHCRLRKEGARIYSA